MLDKLLTYAGKGLLVVVVVVLLGTLLISLAGFAITIWNMFLMTMQASYGC